MEFTIMGHKVSLRVVQQDRMKKLLAKPAELCMISIGMYQEEQCQDSIRELLSMEGVVWKVARGAVSVLRTGA